MSRSGYNEEGDCENLELYRNAVDRAIHGKRGQAFLRELAAAMDAMPDKSLIAHELVNEKGACAIGVVCKARGVDVSRVNYEDPHSVARAVGIAWSMAAEIEYMNDEFYHDWSWASPRETDQERWTRMRKWVSEQLPPA